LVGTQLGIKGCGTRGFAMDWSAYSGDALITVVAIAITCMAMAALLRAFRAAHARRMQSLEAAQSFLKIHFDAAEEFLTDPTPSEGLKKFICSASAICGRKDVALHFREFVLRLRKEPSKIDRSDELLADVEKLESYRPDIAGVFYEAFLAGIKAMILRWPETEDAFIPLMSGPQQEPSKEFKEQSRGILQAAKQACAA
jgi:hypothetical protein